MPQDPKKELRRFILKYLIIVGIGLVVSGGSLSGLGLVLLLAGCAHALFLKAASDTGHVTYERMNERGEWSVETVGQLEKTVAGQTMMRLIRNQTLYMMILCFLSGLAVIVLADYV